MGQIVFNGQKPKYCNLTAITTGSKKDYLIPDGEIWLIDSTNTSKTDGTGKYDYYIKGDGSNTASQLAANKIKVDDSIDISGKADKSEMSVVAGTGADADKTTITLKNGTSATVLTQHQDVSEFLKEGEVFGTGDDSTASFNPYSDTVWSKQQTLSENQKQQIRENIGVGAADNEDIQNVSGELKFADKAYNTSSYSGLGRKYLRKNIVDGKNVLTQTMVNSANTIYHIQYDYVLGENVTIPAGCILKFEGGSIAGTFTLAGSDTVIESEKCCIKKDVTIGGTWGNQTVYSKWLEFVSSDDGTTDNVVQFKQLQNLINGTKGCKVEFECGYYQSSVLMATPDKYKEIDGVTYPYWPTNVYAKDTEIVLHVQEIPFVDINLNGSTIKMINAVCPKAVVLMVDGVKNSYVHDGAIIGLAYDYSYSEYVNYNNTISRDYEWQGGVYQHGGFCTIYSMNIHHFNGDGIIVGGGHWYYSANNIVDYYAKGYFIENSEVSYCGRNGVTLHSSKEGQLKNVHIHHVGSDAASGVIGSDGRMGMSPQAGIDMEFEDGLEDTPIMNWDSLYIHDCRYKTFTFAIVPDHVCKLKSFNCKNSTFIGFPITNNWKSETGNNVFSNCYFENLSDSSVEGSLLGDSLTFNECSFVFKRGGFNFHGENVFNNCTFTDERTENLNIGLGNINNSSGSEYNNCKFTLKGAPGYLGNNSKFYGCTIDFHYVYSWYVLAAEFYDCVFNNEVEDSTYTFGFSQGGYRLPTMTIKLVNCVFDRGGSHGGGADDSFIWLPNAIIENCVFKKGLSLYMNDNYAYTLKNVSTESFSMRPFSSTGQAYSLLMDGCHIDKLFINVNYNDRYDNSLIIKNSEFTVYKYFCNANIEDSKFSFDSTFETADSNNGNKIRAKNSIVGLISSLSSRTSTYELENCYVDGLSEASYKGVAINCVFKTPLPTKGTTSDRPNLDNSRAGFQYFDTTLSKPIYWNGTQWIDATGSAVQ